VLLAVDWTEWCRDLRLLVAAIVIGKRAIPVLVPTALWVAKK
jgi:hypothetical protein